MLDDLHQLLERPRAPAPVPAPGRPTREQAEDAVRTLIRWAGDEPYEQVHVLYLLTREGGRLGIKAMVPLAVAAPTG